MVSRPIRSAICVPTVVFKSPYWGNWAMILLDGAVCCPSLISSGDGRSSTILCRAEISEFAFWQTSALFGLRRRDRGEPLMRSSANDIFLPDLPKQVVSQPCVELSGIRPAELRGLPLSFDNHDVLRLKAVNKGAGLRTDENLRMARSSPKQRSNHLERIRMQSEFRVINSNCF